MVIDSILGDLNQQQRAAAIHGDDPLLIVAGAGTGKTTTLAHRVACLIAGGVAPERVLLLTFTRRAAAELIRRVEAILRRLQGCEHAIGARQSPLASRKVWGGTFHSVSARLLRQHGGMIGLDREFTILDRGDSQDLMNTLRAQLNLSESRTRFPLKGTCFEIYSRCVNSQNRLESVLKSHFPWCIEHQERLDQLFREYVDRKEAQAVLDYDDLLLFWDAMVSEPAVAELLRVQFDRILVDEYQDTNLLQASILRKLCPDGRGLTVVGDDAQSIYSFRAAAVENILDFPKLFAKTTIVTLEQNYRSMQPILDLANCVIGYASRRHAKNLWSDRAGGIRPWLVNCTDDNQQADFVIDQALENREDGISLRQQAVLFRASHHSLALEVELVQRNIPFHKYGGLKFVETAHVKDLMAFLRLAENPRDLISGTRVLMLLPGIGHKRASQLMSLLFESGSSFECWQSFKPPAATHDIWAQFVELMQDLAFGRNQSLELAAQIHRVRSFYSPLLENRYEQADARLRDLEQLEQIAVRYPDRATLLSEMALDPPTSTQDFAGDVLRDEDYLVLSTIHSAKGLEWDAVFVIHAVDGNIPSDMATETPEEIEEERRLFYVALTRARQRLYVLHPERYFFYGRHRGDEHSYAQLTRFLPKKACALFEKRIAGLYDNNSADSSLTPVTTTSKIRGRIKGLLS